MTRMISAATDVERRAQSALSSSPIFALREVRVQQTRGGHLVLSGRVGSYYYKQMAQECIRAVAAGCRVVNSIDVD
jgi:osmotically-inducible protein OsmY